MSRNLHGKHFILTLLLCAATSAASADTCDIAFTGGATLHNVPIAITPTEQAQGLSHREDITSGMLFVWPSPALRSFWMKDTKKPISIGFFDKDGVLFQIEDMQPMTKNLHFSLKKTIMALELPAGSFTRLNVKIGNIAQKNC